MTHEFASPYTVTRQNGQEDAAALRYALQFASVRHSTHATVLREIADRIEEQLTPAIEEPQEFGSIVRAAAPHHHRALWTRSPMTGDHYWMSEKGYAEVWPELTDVEVLRVGLGEPVNVHEFMTSAGFGSTPAQEDAYARGYVDGVDSNRPSPVDRSVIHSALREAMAKISLREARLIVERDSSELADAVMKALA